jgi:Tfp pilus assembly PilM family ATPase
VALGLSKVKSRRTRPPIHRVLAIDAGSRSLKLLLAETDFGQLRLLRQERIDLQQEGLVSTDEVQTQLQQLIDQWENPPLALVLPQHLCISHIIELPPSPETEVEKLIEDQALKLSGVSESKIVYDFVRTESPTKNRQQFWVTLSRESDIRDRISSAGIEAGDLCEVTTTANALIAAYRAAVPLAERVILVHIGAQSTVIALLLAGQGAFATSFQMGGDFFARAQNVELNPSRPAAGAKAPATVPAAGASALANGIAGWTAELKRQLDEWFQNQAGLGLNLAAFKWAVSGNALETPALLENLQAKSGLELKPWPTNGSSGCPPGFEVAFGAAVQALGFSPQPVSLLPEDYREAWRKRLKRKRLEIASAVLILIGALLVGVGTWHQVSLIQRKSALLAKVKEGVESVQANADLTSELLNEYDSLRPLFAQQQNTLDALKALALLQQSRSNADFWFVLVADQQSYFNAPAASLSGTNKAAQTNVVPLAVSATSTDSPMLSPLPVKPGFIAEVVVPGEPEAARRVLSDLVNRLNQASVFSKVDLLSDDLRRSLSDPKMVIPDRHFVLGLDFAETSFQQPLRARNAPRPGPRRTTKPEGPEKGSPPQP